MVCSAGAKYVNEIMVENTGSIVTNGTGNGGIALGGVGQWPRIKSVHRT